MTLQVACRRVDRVDGIVPPRRIVRAVAPDGVTRYVAQVDGLNCIHPDRPGLAGREILPEVGLDVVDRCQIRPAVGAEPVIADRAAYSASSADGTSDADTGPDATSVAAPGQPPPASDASPPTIATTASAGSRTANPAPTASTRCTSYASASCGAGRSADSGETTMNTTSSRAIASTSRSQTTAGLGSAVAAAASPSAHNAKCACSSNTAGPSGLAALSSSSAAARVHACVSRNRRLIPGGVSRRQQVRLERSVGQPQHGARQHPHARHRRRRQPLRRAVQIARLQQMAVQKHVGHPHSASTTSPDGPSRPGGRPGGCGGGQHWIGYLLTSEQTHTQVQLLFAHALEDQGLLGDDGLPIRGDQDGPILVAWSDNGSEMTAIDTRQFMALMAIAQHHGRPGTPTDQAHVESFFSHLKGDWPHLTGITDPAALDSELARIRRDYNLVRLHAAIGYVTPDDEHHGRGPAIRRARIAGLKRAHGQRVMENRRRSK